MCGRAQFADDYSELKIRLKFAPDAPAPNFEREKASCEKRPEDAQTPPARLAAVSERLNTMLQSVKTVRTAMDDFYGSLTDEQKAAFDAIGPQQAGGPETPADNCGVR